MLKYDYVIKRDEGDKTRHYSPSLIPTELSDVVYIEGPNSSGKSTLLNLIALGFFGLKLKKDELHPALREKLKNLYDSTHQEVKFSIKVQNEALSTSFTAVKNNFKSKEIQVRRKIGKTDKPISFEQFQRDYKLIYDIPNNPLERLPLLLHEIKNTQHAKGNQVATLKNFMREAISAVKDAKDPRLLADLNKRYTQEQKQFDEMSKKLKEDENHLNELKKYAFSKHYLEYSKLFENIKIKIQQTEKTKKTKKREESKQSREQSAIIYTIKDNIKNAENNYEDASKLLKILISKSDKHRLDIWQNANCKDEIKEPEINQSLRQESRYFINHLKEMLEDIDEETIGEARLLRALKNLLKEYSYSAITIPGTNKSVNEFLEIINKELRKFEKIETTNENIEKCIESLNGLLTNIEATINLLSKYKKISKDRDKTQKDLEEATRADEYEILEKRFFEFENKKNYYAKELNKINVDLLNIDNIYELRKNTFKMYEKYTENQIVDSINNFKANILGLKKELDKLNRSIDYIKKEIERIEKKKPHKYQNHIAKLESCLTTLQDLEKKLLVTFDEYINKIIAWDSSRDTLTSDEQEYANCIAEFLAEKVRYIKHIDQNLMVKKIDVINKEIIADSKRRIKFADLGTGQSQGAYIRGLLSMSDNRKIIALFDEVAMMDATTLKPIFDKLKLLYKENKLLLGMIVQKAEDVRVKSLI